VDPGYAFAEGANLAFCGHILSLDKSSSVEQSCKANEVGKR
jgi:hypothetical protein